LVNEVSGALVSTVNASGLEAALSLPVASLAVAATECAPSASAGEATHVHCEPASVTAVQTVTDPSRTITWLPASAVPSSVGVALARNAPDAGAVNAGAAGAVASTVNMVGADAGPTLPKSSTAVAVT